MYQIIGVRSDKREVIATSVKPGDALTQFRAAQNDYPEVIVLTPQGLEIDGFELSRRYHDEQARICE